MGQLTLYRKILFFEIFSLLIPSGKQSKFGVTQHVRWIRSGATIHHFAAATSSFKIKVLCRHTDCGFLREPTVRVDRHPDLKKDQELLLSIPAIGRITSRLILAVIRGKDFKTATECAAFLGVIPKIQESGVFRGHSAPSKKSDPLI